MWNERKDCLRMNESVGWTSSRLTIGLLNLKRPQLIEYSKFYWALQSTATQENYRSG